MDSRERLEENETHAETETPAVTRSANELLDEIPGSVVATDESLGFDLSASLRKLPLEVLVVARKVAEPAENHLGFVELALEHEVTRALADEEHADGQESSGNDLAAKEAKLGSAGFEEVQEVTSNVHADREFPLEVVGRQAEGRERTG